MTKLFFTIIVCFISLTSIFAQKPLSDPNGTWTILSDYSDEFNATTGLDLTKWDNDINNWGVWIWDTKNVWVTEGNLHIRMQNIENNRNGKTFYFTSGAVRQKKTITYGYFEARVKGCPTFPGVCPAFWMYSSKQALNNVTYNEIDFMEVQQRQHNIKGIDTNTHYSINGAPWVDTKNFYNAPFAPNDGFHVYGCNVTPSNITFYIDGVQVATNTNQYFILPMNIIFSMGVRPPLMTYENAKKVPVEIKNAPGFPTEMLVDYVRVWLEK
ncbi:MAG: family 16 glycosylhydrolase [Bacteroidales bacterium]